MCVSGGGALFFGLVSSDLWFGLFGGGAASAVITQMHGCLYGVKIVVWGDVMSAS